MAFFRMPKPFDMQAKASVSKLDAISPLRANYLYRDICRQLLECNLKHFFAFMTHYAVIAGFQDIWARLDYFMGDALYMPPISRFYARFLVKARAFESSPQRSSNAE